MLKLGHIIYSNCFPPHAGIVQDKVSFPFRLIEGIPTQLNQLLYDGQLDVSPSSSIEYAINPGRYLLLPNFSITSRKSVMSIILQSRVPFEDLHKKTVALTSASATSNVLLRILLEAQHAIHPHYTRYVQGTEQPPEAADAFLTIGDLAITRPQAPGYAYRYDLGERWYQFTGLPFVFAVWHINYKKSIEHELASLYDILLASKRYGLEHVQELALDQSLRFGIPPDVLVRYWQSFSYDCGEPEQTGLLAFYRYAAQIGAIASVPELHFWSKS
jgi:chorismate dehydratase